MPKSIIQKRMDAAWDAVAAAVSSGLVVVGEKTLVDVVPTVAKRPAPPTWRPMTTSAQGAGQLRLRESTPPPTVVDYEFRLTIHYDALDCPDHEEITAWAAAARTFELFDVLGRLAVMGRAQHGVDVLDEAVAPSGGWGQIRCVTLKLDPVVVKRLEEVKRLDWEGPVLLTERLPRASWVDCLLLRKGGGPHVRRKAGLTLGWLPAEGGAVDLVLAEQFEIVNAGEETVAAIGLLPG